MARASKAMPRSFNEILRQALRSPKALSRAEVLETLHSHFGDRVGSFFGRSEQLEHIARRADREGSALLLRAAELRQDCIPRQSPFLPGLRRADLALGPGSLRAILALASNGGRPCLVMVEGLAPEDAAPWVEQEAKALPVSILLPPLEQEISELLPSLPPAPSTPRLRILPQGERSNGPTHLCLSRLIEESLDAAARLLGTQRLEASSLDIEAVASGGLTLARSLEQEPELRFRSVLVRDALYGALPWRLQNLLEQNPATCIVVEALPHQRESLPVLDPARISIQSVRPINRVRQLLAQKVKVPS